MKKWMALILLLVCLLILTACNAAGDVDDTQLDLPATGQQETLHSCAPFSTYLDEKNFVPGMTQNDLISQAEAYSYSGKAVIEHVPGIFWDGPRGGGLDMNGELFGFSNSFEASEDNTYADYSNRFYTYVPIEGLTLPYGISFEDTAATALQKMGFDLKARDLKKIPTGTMTLCSEGNSFLELTKSASGQYVYVLKYTENYQATRPDGRKTNLTRTVTMSFGTESDQLGLFEISIHETYPTDEIPGAVVHLVEIRDIAEEENIACDSALEKFWEDETNAYYFECVKSQYVYAMDSTGMSFDITTALNKGLATIEDLDYFGIEYITKHKPEK